MTRLTSMWPRWTTLRRAGVAGAVCLSGLFGCAGDTTGPAPVDGSSLYWALTLNHSAVTLSMTAPYDTLRLVATPRTAQGAPLAGGGPAQYQVAGNDTSVLIDQNGLLRAHVPVAQVTITVSQTVGGITLRRDVIVRVDTATHPPKFARLAVSVTGGQTSVSCRFVGSVSAVALDDNGGPIPDVPIEYASGNDDIAKVTNPGASTHFVCRPGTHLVTLYATATIYGVARTDSLVVTVTPDPVLAVAIRSRVSASGAVEDYFNPGTLTIAAGGSVAWANLSGDTADVVFDDPARVTAIEAPVSVIDGFGMSIAPSGAGNILPFASDTAGGVFASLNAANYRARSFPAAGTYHYRNTRSGATGTIVVEDASASARNVAP